MYVDMLGGTEHCISTGNVMFRYIVNDKKQHIYIVGIIAKEGKILPKDIMDIKGAMADFVKKVAEGWVIYASVNSNSRSLIDRVKRLAAKVGHKEIFEKSLGKIGFLDKPEFTFDTIVIATDKDKLTRPI